MYPTLPKDEVLSEVKRRIKESSLFNITHNSALIKLESYGAMYSRTDQVNFVEDNL